MDTGTAWQRILDLEAATARVVEEPDSDEHDKADRLQQMADLLSRERGILLHRLAGGDAAPAAWKTPPGGQ